jgi:hypothetical protein
MTRTDVVRSLFDAYAAGDRDSADRLLADDMHFTSPYDNRLDKAGYFEHCWPPPPDLQSFDIVRTAEVDDTVYVTYEAGGVGRNTEAITFDEDDRIVEVEVYFGWSLPHPLAEGEHRVD